ILSVHFEKDLSRPDAEGRRDRAAPGPGRAGRVRRPDGAGLVPLPIPPAHLRILRPKGSSSPTRIIDTTYTTWHGRIRHFRPVSGAIPPRLVVAFNLATGFPSLSRNRALTAQSSSSLTTFTTSTFRPFLSARSETLSSSFSNGRPSSLEWIGLPLR